MNKVCRIGNIIGQGNLYIKTTIEDGKLSISGVIGPLANGDARGGCGQIDMEFKHRNPTQNDKRYTNLITPRQIQYAPGWSAKKWLDLLDIWSQYHLNDMNPACEHQRRDFDTKKELTIIKYMLNTDTWQEQKAIKARAVDSLIDHCTASVKAAEQRLLSLPLSFTMPEGKPLDLYQNKHYKEDGRETKTAGWIYPKDHPEGLLTEPCPVCGYKYGSAWLKVELPQPVIDFIEALPETDKSPAWV